MEWILLFDSGCSACTKAARAVADESNSPIRTQSLLDAESQMLVRRAGLQEATGPVLVAIDGDTVHAWTGNALRLRLARQIGVRRAFRILRELNTDLASEGEGMQRRAFLGRVGAAAGVLLAGAAAPAWAGDARRRLTSRLLRRHSEHSPQVAALRRSSLAAEAEARFGELDWNVVVEHTRRGLLAIPSSRSQAGRAHILVTNLPSASRRNPLIAMVVEVRRHERGARARLLCIDGRPLSSPSSSDLAQLLGGKQGRPLHPLVHPAGVGPGNGDCIEVQFEFFFAQNMCQNYVQGCLTGSGLMRISECLALLSCVLTSITQAIEVCNGV